MKNLITAFVLSSISAFSTYAAEEAAQSNIAAPVILDRKEVTVTQNPVVLARTAATPKKVYVSMPVQMSNTQCIRYATRIVYGADPSCGYDSVIRYRCTSNYPGCHRVCGPRGCHTVCYSPHPTCYSYIDRYMRSCNHSESYCAQTGIVTSTAMKTVKIKFRNLPDLSGEQMDIFELNGVQRSVNHSDVIYDMKAQATSAPYEIKVRQNNDKILIKRQ